MEKENSIVRILNMQPHSIVEIHEKPHFRVLRVHSGWLYNFWSNEKGIYDTNWVFVPYKG